MVMAIDGPNEDGMPSTPHTYADDGVAPASEEAGAALIADDEADIIVGAPVERVNPLGSDVTFRSAVFLPLSRLVSKSLLVQPEKEMPTYLCFAIDKHGCIQHSRCRA